MRDALRKKQLIASYTSKYFMIFILRHL